MVHSGFHHKAPHYLADYTAFQSLMWPVDDIFVLPGVITSLCLDIVSARMGVRYLPAKLHDAHWVMICVIRRLALTVSDVCLKLGCFRVPVYIQRVRGIALYAIYKFTTNLHTYLLITMLIKTNMHSQRRRQNFKLASIWAPQISIFASVVHNYVVNV